MEKVLTIIKEIVHQKNQKTVYSPSSCSKLKLVQISYSCQTQKKIFWRMLETKHVTMVRGKYYGSRCQLFLLKLLISLRKFRFFILQKILKIIKMFFSCFFVFSLEGSLGNPKWFFYNIASKTLLLFWRVQNVCIYSIWITLARITWQTLWDVLIVTSGCIWWWIEFKALPSEQIKQHSQQQVNTLN